MTYWTHARVSYLKSAVRIAACVGALFITSPRASLIVLAAGLAVAEWLGVIEELGERGE